MRIIPLGVKNDTIHFFCTRDMSGLRI